MKKLEIFMVLVLAACSSVEPVLPKKSTVRVLFTSNRYLEIEPCGCMINPRGGVEREWEFLQVLKQRQPASFLTLSTGTLFLPPPAEFKSQLFKDHHYERKAEAVIEALNALEYRAHAPEMADLVHGVSAIRKLEAKAQFPFVSSNLVNEKNEFLFKQRVDLEIEGKKVAILGLSSDTVAKEYGKVPGVKVLPTDEALKRALEGVSADLVIVLSSQRQKMEIEYKKSFEPVHLVLGGSPDESTELAHQIGTRTLHYNPMEKGKEIGVFSFDFSNPIQSFYNLEVARVNTQTRRDWAQQISEMEQTLKRTPADAKLRQRRNRLAGFRDRLIDMDASAPVGATVFEIEGRHLTDDLKPKDPAKNPLSKIVESYKARVRSLALEER